MTVRSENSQIVLGRCVGREEELALLQERLREVQESGPRLVRVLGSDGVGKTRLLEEFRGRARLAGGVALDGRCEPGTAFAPFATIVDRGLRFLADMGRTPSFQELDLSCHEGCHRFWHQHGRSSARPGLALGQGSRAARDRRLRFFEAVRGLILEVGGIRPPVILLHDLDRADVGTLQLLRFLLDGAGPLAEGVPTRPSLRALFVASDTRSLATEHHAFLDDHEAVERLELGPLDEDGVRQLLADPSMVRKVLERTAGYPERLSLLLGGTPTTPEALVERRLAEVSPEVRSLAEALCALEQGSEFELCAEVAGVAPDDTLRQSFSGLALVDATPLDGALRYHFRRDRQRRLLYGQLSIDRRADLHRRAAAALRARGSERAAHHALLAGEWQSALAWVMEEVDRLAARHAHAEAAARVEEVLEEVPSSEIDAEMLGQARQVLCELHRVVGQYPKALDHARALFDSKPDDPAAAHRVGRLLMLAGELEQASPMLDQARGLAKAAGDERTRATVEGLLAEVHYQRGEYELAERWAGHSVAHAEDALNDVSLVLQARNTLGKVQLARRQADAAFDVFYENAARAEEAGLNEAQAQALTNLGVARMTQQRLDEAGQFFERALEVAAGSNDSRYEAIATENLAVVAHLRRRYGEALARYQEAIGLLQRLGNRAMLTRVGINLGELYLTLGDTLRARSLCDFAQQVGGPSLPPGVEAECMLLRGRVDVAAGRRVSGRTALVRSLELYRGLGISSTLEPLLELTRLALEDGEVGHASELLRDAPEVGSPKLLAERALVEALVARAAGSEGALELAERASEMADATGDDALRLPALATLARLQMDGGDGVRARRSLRRAYDVETQLASEVPGEARPLWEKRPARRMLEQADTHVVARTGRAVRTLQPRLERPRIRPPELDERFPEIVGGSVAITRMLEVIDKVAESDALVLVRGESGTGKELVAEALHRHSARSSRPIVKVNCAALVETLLLSELFGHEKGAFTGAASRKKGRFELADGGTLFLDEIGDISPKTQVALLRVLQEREFERVGGTSPIRVDVRIVAATHRDLEAMVAEGSFREDLYYRLRGVSIESPSLRDRMEDLDELVPAILARIARERSQPPLEIGTGTISLLRRHSWPGNIRELENVLRSASLFATNGVLQPGDFGAFEALFGPVRAPEEPVGHSDSEPPLALDPAVDLESAIYHRVKAGETSLLEWKKVIERECIVRALAETEGNITRAANLLGMKRPRLSQLAKQYDLLPRAQKAARK